LQYPVSGQIFFSSAEKFYQFFDVSTSTKHVILDLGHTHIWDITSVNMLNTVVQKFRDQGIDIEVVGLNEASSTLIDRYNPL
jgi:SulP family sulfate permease